MSFIKTQFETLFALAMSYAAESDNVDYDNEVCVEGTEVYIYVDGIGTVTIENTCNKMNITLEKTAFHRPVTITDGAAELIGREYVIMETIQDILKSVKGE